jgi:hypothetical protein
MQTTSHLLMIRPVNFSFNTETAVNNAFQAQQDIDAQEKALSEFNSFIYRLQQNGTDVTVVDDTAAPYTPDSIFPNNWISFHSDGSLFLYPMFALNRRQERKAHVIDAIKSKFQVSRVIDLSGLENQDEFLEGTGSMVLDRDSKVAYACLSPRTKLKALERFSHESGFSIESFTSVDTNGQEIYHTNVMMCVADTFVVICLDSIKEALERKSVVNRINSSNKEIIEISFDQMNHFAGNMLQVQNKKGEKKLVMSSQAFQSLFPSQISAIERHCSILHSSLETIERNGGGSARCMMAEIFLPEK